MRISRAMRALAIAILAAIALVLIIPIYMRAATAGLRYIAPDNIPRTDAALVLGASVYDGKPSPILEERAAAAVTLFNAGKVGAIIVSGDNGELSHDEVTPVRKYLLKAGIPAGRIFLDHAGFDTYSSVYRARAIFGAQSLTVVTQDFHLPRALYIARRLGIIAYGFQPEGSKGDAFDYLREIPASAKALFDLAVHRLPKYLGPTIPLSGDGSTTWY